MNMNREFNNVTLVKLKSCAVLAIKLFECAAKMCFAMYHYRSALACVSEAAGCCISKSLHFHEKYFRACLEYHSADLSGDLVVCFCQIVFIFTNYADTKVPNMTTEFISRPSAQACASHGCSLVLIVKFMTF